MSFSTSLLLLFSFNHHPCPQIYTVNVLEAISIWGFILAGLVAAFFIFFFIIGFCRVGWSRFGFHKIAEHNRILRCLGFQSFHRWESRRKKPRSPNRKFKLKMRACSNQSWFVQLNLAFFVRISSFTLSLLKLIFYWYLWGWLNNSFKTRFLGSKIKMSGTQPVSDSVAYLALIGLCLDSEKFEMLETNESLEYTNILILHVFVDMLLWKGVMTNVILITYYTKLKVLQ